MDGPKIPQMARDVGPFILCPSVEKNLQYLTISERLALKEGTNKFYTIKVLTLKDRSKVEADEDKYKEAKICLHNEYAILNLLKGKEGVIQHHGLFQDVVEEEVEKDGKWIRTGEKHTKIYLVFDCYTPNDFCPKYKSLIKLWPYLIENKKKLREREALGIFFSVLKIVESLHKINVVHRNLRLDTIVLNKETREVVITNFPDATLLTTENEVLMDQRSLTLYSAPDVKNGKRYSGKPSDMWALGVILYVLLYGKFPFYDTRGGRELFQRIEAGEYELPVRNNVSLASIRLIQSLLTVDTRKRLNALQALHSLRGMIASEHPLPPEPMQVVPECFPEHGSSVWKEGKNWVQSDENKIVLKKALSMGEVESLLTSLATSVPQQRSRNENGVVDENVSANPDHEPPAKISKQNPGFMASKVQVTKTNEGAFNLKIGHLKDLHTIYLRNQARRAATAAGIENVYNIVQS